MQPKPLRMADLKGTVHSTKSPYTLSSYVSDDAPKGLSKRQIEAHINAHNARVRKIVKGNYSEHVIGCDSQGENNAT